VTSPSAVLAYYRKDGMNLRETGQEDVDWMHVVQDMTSGGLL